MQYSVKIVDESVDVVVLEDGKTGNTGMNAFLKLFLDLNQHHRLIFMEKLVTNGKQQIVSKAYHPKPYSIYAKKLES